MKREGTLGNGEVVWEYNELRQCLFEQRNQFNCLHAIVALKLRCCCCFGYARGSNKHWPCYRRGGGKGTTQRTTTTSHPDDTEPTELLYSKHTSSNININMGPIFKLTGFGIYNNNSYLQKKTLNTTKWINSYSITHIFNYSH